MRGIQCRTCGAPMRRTSTSSGNCMGIMVALTVFIVGVCLSVVGLFIIGIPVCLCALFMGGKRSKVWMCTRCRSIIARG